MKVRNKDNFYTFLYFLTFNCVGYILDFAKSNITNCNKNYYN